jgi:hypothetical protein
LSKREQCSPILSQKPRSKSARDKALQKPLADSVYTNSPTSSRIAHPKKPRHHLLSVASNLKALGATADDRINLLGKQDQQR